MGDIQTPQLIEGNVNSLTDGPVIPGEPAKKSTLVGGIFNTQFPAPTNGQQVALQLSSTGRLLTDSSGVVQPVTFMPEAKEVVHFYATASGIATGALGTISYTVKDGKNLYLKSIQAASSGGPCKVQLQSNNKTYVTTFYSASVLQVEVNFPQPIVFPGKTVISITIQNNAFAAQDVYAFLNGYEV